MVFVCHRVSENEIVSKQKLGAYFAFLGLELQKYGNRIERRVQSHSIEMIICTLTLIKS